ncbi:uncharacterized protein taf1c [Xenentodon cancila]
MWCHTEPVPIPLLSPKKAFLGPSTPPDPLDFTEHMQNFFTDHFQDAFSCMSGLLGENFYFGFKKKKELYRKGAVNMWKIRFFFDILKYKICHQSYQSSVLKRYCSLMSDVIHDIPPELLGSLLHEELTEQRDRMLFFERASGGALAFIPFSQSSCSSQRGCLLYPGSQGLDRLMEMRYYDTGSCLDARSSKPISFQLKAPIRQISYASHSDDACVAVRSDHFCGVWRFSERNKPHLLQVINTNEVATCVNVSPHILGEVLVANESGVASLWTVGHGMQRVRVEESNLYFNAKSSWRWCEFSAHPRVMLYADRTGVELTDMRASPICSHTLFSISSSSECRSGERLILSKYLGAVHPFHHLITTQYSAYIMDDRFPCVPMLKWDHMMQSPPVFCHPVPESAALDSGAGEWSTSKVLLGSHSSQEITLLQYSGGRVTACVGHGPPQALLRPKEAPKHLPVQVPHRLDAETSRLSSPAAGVTCIQRKAGRRHGSQGRMCVLQLTEAGDIFYQVLEHKRPEERPSERAAEELPPPALGSERAEPPPLGSQDGPTQDVAACSIVAETPEREQQIQTTHFNSASESESSGRKQNRIQLDVFDSEAQVGDQLIQMDLSNKDGSVAKINQADNTKKDGNEEEAAGSSGSRASHNLSQRHSPVTLSSSTFVTWKQWLQKMMQKRCEEKGSPQSFQHFKIRTKGLLRLPNTNTRDTFEKGHVESLRKHMRSCMSRCSLLVNSTVSASHGVSDVLPVPSKVDTDIWTDPLSQRLTLSWQGEGAWQAWWEEQLGMNRETKLEALRRRRRREKEARRAAGHRLELSGSFTSSITYQSEINDFTSSAGWSSATSHDAWSDGDGGGPLSQLSAFLEHEAQMVSTSSSTQTVTQDPTPTISSRRVEDTISDQQMPGGPGSLSLSLSQTKSPMATPTSLRTTKRPAEDSLNTLISAQDDLSQKDFLEKRDKRDTLPVHAASSSSSQLHSSQPLLLRGSRSALSSSQSSQGRLGLSQASQQKKKSRMGF